MSACFIAIVFSPLSLPNVQSRQDSIVCSPFCLHPINNSSTNNYTSPLHVSFLLGFYLPLHLVSGTCVCHLSYFCPFTCSIRPFLWHLLILQNLGRLYCNPVYYNYFVPFPLLLHADVFMVLLYLKPLFLILLHFSM